jgi:hypothetical protein
MTDNQISVYLGTAADGVNIVEKDDGHSKIILAQSSQDFAAARAGVASLDGLQVIVTETELATWYDPMELSGWVSALRPGATVSITVKSHNNNGGGVDTQRIHTSFLLAGLVVTSERREADGSRTWTATRKSSQTITTAPAPLKEKTIQISLNQNDDDDDDGLIDEDDLLKEEHGLIAPPSVQPRTSKGGDDCGGRKACDDCTCGRAEQEANGSNTHEHKEDEHKSSCGKCGLGDAFRCASCPYLGLPAFKPGEEHLVLQLKDDL